MNKLNHIAIIMDGNGRWGQKKRGNRNYGHLAGVKTVQKIVEASILLKIPIISLYVFSTENWSRPKSEINYLFNLINIYFKKEIKNIIKKQLSPKHIPSKIIIMSDIPKTKSGKIVEMTVKKIINNEKIDNLNSLINPECLEEYYEIAKKLNAG